MNDEMIMAPKRSPSADLERQHRSLMEDYRPAPVVFVAEPPPIERQVIVRTFTTYGAYEDPI